MERSKTLSVREKIEANKARRRKQWSDSKKKYYEARHLRKVREALPRTPLKRAAVLSAYVDPARISKSPAVKKFHNDKSSTINSHGDIESGILNSIKPMLNTVKRRRSDEARTTLNIIKSSVSGENTKRHGAATDLSKKLGIKPAAIKHGGKVRNQILHSMDSVFEYTKRKTRSDKLSKTVKENV